MEVLSVGVCSFITHVQQNRCDGKKCEIVRSHPGNTILNSQNFTHVPVYASPAGGALHILQGILTRFSALPPRGGGVSSFTGERCHLGGIIGIIGIPWLGSETE